MLMQVGQMYLTVDDESPWHAQYIFGSDYLYLCDVHGSSKVQLNTDVPLNPVVATKGRTVHLWNAREGHGEITVELLDETSMTLKSMFSDYEFCLRCHRGEIGLVVRKVEPKQLLPSKYDSIEKTPS